MIKKEEGTLTALRNGINSLSKEDTVGGMRFVEDLEARVEMSKRKQKTLENEGFER